MDTNPAPDGTFTTRLQRLFVERPNPRTRRPYSDEHVGAATGLSKTQVWNLRTGRATNPSMETIAGLASFFGVTPGYFFSTSDTGDAELDALLTDSGARRIAARAADLSPAGQEMILSVLDQIRRMEGRSGTP